jgi:hypothetical protein
MNNIPQCLNERGRERRMKKRDEWERKTREDTNTFVFGNNNACLDDPTD